VKVRIVVLAVIAVAAVTPAAYSSASSSRTDVEPVGSGFAGPVSARPRALDVDRSSSTSTLRAIRCASALPDTRCWVTLNLK